MVRVFIKGGVWKNSEDEILKAAVMKYGKQQWARVASLLNRKSAKQCKARWNEWLDPSVRKVEWSRAEEEKLLHLAKLMPAQWRTIGPLVGRTATQCQEHYERLLDEAAAAAGDEASSSSSAAAAAAVTTAGGARRLRPGEIDPHPETKPARPDPIDMDEDEIEMLQEARARLANTQGKKAKRKAREKMLAEAKRLADLQKRRELKAAGLLSGQARTKVRGKKRKEIDLGVEIPFHKPAPAGFHSTASEDARAESIRNKRLKDVDFKRLNEAQYRSRDREAANAQKKEEARLRALERSNMQYVVAEVSKRNDPLAQRKRGVLTMPDPSVSEDEMRRVGKLGEAAIAGRNEGLMTGGATDALLGDYSDRPLPTPMRTPATSGQAPSTQETIMREASNLRMIQAGQTPLLGGENPDLLAGGPSSKESSANKATPMVGKTPSATPMITTDRTVNQTPMSLAHRDQLGLNRPSSQMHPGMGGDYDGADDAISVGGTSFATSAAGTSAMSIREMAREERRAAKRARRELEMALANLPAPQFEYELAAPGAMPEEEDEDGALARRVSMEQDAADEDAEEMELLRKEAERVYEERSSVMKRADLPRPGPGPILREAVVMNPKDIDAAEVMVQEEMLTLLQHDAHSHPVLVDESDPAAIHGAAAENGDKKGKKDKKKKKRKKGSGASGLASAPPPEKPLHFVPEEALDSAKNLVKKEADSALEEKKAEMSVARGVSGGDDAIICALTEEIAREARKGASSQVFLDDGSRRGWLDSDGTKNDRLAALRAEYRAIKEASDALRSRADKVESKLSIRNGGYIKRESGLRDASLQSFAELQHSKIEEEVYGMLMAHEKRGIEGRTEKLQQEIDRLERDEAAAQKRYGNLLHERNRLMVKIRLQQK